MFQENAEIVHTADHLLDPLNLANDLTNADSVILNGKFGNKITPHQLHTIGSGYKNSTAKRITKTKAIKKKEFKIRIGKDFQAVCPPLIPVAERNLESIPDRALTVWSPTEDLSESMLQTYLTLTHKKFGYNIEQGLAMLYWHKFNIQESIRDLENFAPFPEEWTREDKIIFEEALLFHGKNFIRIRELLPDKSVGGLIDYYYSWKKRAQHRPKERRGRPRIRKRKQPSELRFYD